MKFKKEKRKQQQQKRQTTILEKPRRNQRKWAQPMSLCLCLCWHEMGYKFKEWPNQIAQYIYHFTQLNPTFDWHNASLFWETISGCVCETLWCCCFPSSLLRFSWNIHLLDVDNTACSLCTPLLPHSACISYTLLAAARVSVCLFVCLCCWSVGILSMRMGKINRIILRHIYFSCCNIRPFGPHTIAIQTKAGAREREWARRWN